MDEDEKLAVNFELEIQTIPLSTTTVYNAAGFYPCSQVLPGSLVHCITYTRVDTI